MKAVLCEGQLLHQVLARNLI